ncbi:MAG: NAD-dependent epimerase/dehydratase family protein [Terrimicrobiaceae bacterium]
MKILVTGGSGFIGSHVVEHYQQHAEVVVLDNFRTGKKSNLDGLRCRLVEGSIEDRELLGEIMKDVDYVFHLAAMVSVPESMSKPAETVRLNVHGLLNVLDAARANGVRKLVLASSAAVYGENPVQPKVETMTPDPRSPYAITKLDGEFYCDLYRREGWLQTACLRFFNVFGPRQDPNSAYAAAVPIFLDRARNNQAITIYGDGGQTRDFIYVKDIVGALAFAAETPTVSGVFNAGYGNAITILELAEEIISLTRSQSKLDFQTARAGDIRHSTSNPQKLGAAGWSPKFDVASGLKQLMEMNAPSRPVKKNEPKGAFNTKEVVSPAPR